LVEGLCDGMAPFRRRVSYTTCPRHSTSIRQQRSHQRHILCGILLTVYPQYI
jgi:hypothetical protein